MTMTDAEGNTSPEATPEVHIPRVPSGKVSSFTYTGGGSMNNFSSLNPGDGDSGGSSSKGKDSKKKKTDVVDRYKEVKYR